MDHKHSDEAAVYLLDPEKAHPSESSRTTSRFLNWTTSHKLFVVQALLLAINVILVANQWKLPVLRRSPSSLPYYTPIEEAVEWESQFFDVDIGHTTKYSGPPSNAIDLAWHDLFENSNLRVTAEELSRMNKTSLGIADGNGYMGNLDVHHQLHCLKYLRFFVYPEYYAKEIEEKGTVHADHCIENLRRNIMCNPSLEILTLHWHPDRAGPKPDFSYEHTCMNWEKLDAWMWERSFDVFDKTLLVNPTLSAQPDQPSSTSSPE